MSTDPRRRPVPPPPPPPPLDEASSEPQATNTDTNGTHDVNKRDLSPQQAHAEQKKDAGYKLRFCTVCASNNNRSMEAHLRLTTSPTPYPTISFGTGSYVRLPGPSINQPNVYTFNNTSYAAMYNELLEKDKRLYTANGILPMLERNKNVKWGPERWQDWKVGVPRVGKRWHTQGGTSLDGGANAEYKDDKGYEGTEAGTVDVVFTCEDRCWDAVVDDLLNRGGPLNRPVHVFNVDIKDNHEEALVGGRAILELADALNKAAQEERDAWLNGGGHVHAFDGGSSHARAGFDERVPDILADWQERWPKLPALWTLAWL